MKKLIPIFIAVLTIAAFLAVFTLMLHVNPNEQKIDALSSAITTFEKMLSDNQQSESMLLENVMATEKAIKKFESRRRWHYVGNYIMAVVFGLIAAGALVIIIFTISYRLTKSNREIGKQTGSNTEP
jgi:uncharacterized membrane protein